VPGRVGVDPEAAVLGGLVLVHGPPSRQHRRLVRVDGAGPQVEVELLRVRPAGPGRCLEVVDPLEGQGRPPGLSGDRPPPGGTSVAQSRSEPSSSGQPSTAL